ncbi:MAG: SET domain-containing protein [Acidobacteria bacterium]|nr:SET domain-containing protein [Acidobacteriota bacterium]
MNETDDRFYVAPSTLAGAGHGLFARVTLKEGSRLSVIGVLVQANSDSDRCTAFADAHKVRVGGQLLIPLGFGAMVNHSSSPNLGRVIEGDAVHLQLLRDVAAGEELFFTYSAYAQQRFRLSS